MARLSVISCVFIILSRTLTVINAFLQEVSRLNAQEVFSGMTVACLAVKSHFPFLFIQMFV